MNYSQSVTPLIKIPKFRFIGSKHNILSYICEVLIKEKISGDVFFDVFSGSASVGRYFKNSFAIISNDNLYFSYILQKAFIVLNEDPYFKSLYEVRLPSQSHNRIYSVLEFLNNASGIKGFVFKHYTPASKVIDGVERKYFSETNGKKIDSIRSKINEWFNSKQIDESEYSYLIASLLLAVQKVSNISGTYGAYNKIWDPRSHKTIFLKPIEILPSSFEHKAYNRDSFDILGEVSCDIAYVDPPYNARQYIANYHLLETIARYDSPEISGKTGIRQYTVKDKSVFCSKISVGPSLLKLLNGLNAKCVILSYNSEGLLSKHDIETIFANSKYHNVKLYEYPYRRFKSNHNTQKRAVNEYIFIGVGTK